MRNPLGKPLGEGYPRPNQPWQCGLGDEGPPCPLGPTIRGHCPAATACQPARQGDRWICNRSELRGGPCEHGPGHDGACPHVFHCKPRRSLRSRRGQFVMGAFLAAVGAALMTLSGSWRNELIAPGPLTVHHAQLVAGNSSTLRCGNCHAAGNARLSDWLAHTRGQQRLAPGQVDLCLACHKQQIPADLARRAHNVPLEVLASGELGISRIDSANGSQRRQTLGQPADIQTLASSATSVGRDESNYGRRRDPRAEIACAACHREHQGTTYDLTAIGNQECQACHQQRFESFADDHPDFSDWPTNASDAIEFNHASHKTVHFAAAGQTFHCAHCHEATASNRAESTLGYEQGCASCHEKALQASVSSGIPLLAVPMIDIELLEEVGAAADAWPEGATGDFDGALPAFLRLLFTGDESTTRAQELLGPQLDLFDVDPDDEEHLRAAGELAGAIGRFSAELAEHGRGALAAKLAAALGRELTDDELRALAAGLSQESLRAMRTHWFEGAPAEGELRPDSASNSGQWSLDHRGYALRYFPVGHADPWLRSWIDLAVAAANGPHRERAEPILKELLAPTAPGLCGSCHTAEQDRHGAWSIEWKAADPALPSQPFTHFSHAPHLLQPQLADCTACHAVQTPEQALATSSDFAPLSKQRCAECHHAGAVGDHCTQCHSYHPAGFDSHLREEVLRGL